MRVQEQGEGAAVRSPDPLVDGRPWHWAAAVALTLPLLIVALPLCLAASLLEGARRALR